jgi:hypothetical protein
MSGRIDAARQPAHHRHAERREVGAQARGQFQRHRRRRARSDDGDGGRVEAGERAAIPQHRRAIGDGEERRGKSRVVPRQRVDAVRARALAHFTGARGERVGAFQQFGIVGLQAGGEADAREVVDERERNRVVQGHERLRAWRPLVARRARHPRWWMGTRARGRGPRGATRHLVHSTRDRLYAAQISGSHARCDGFGKQNRTARRQNHQFDAQFHADAWYMPCSDGLSY